jgi:Xaa-Pro aminopeptidase
MKKTFPLISVFVLLALALAFSTGSVPAGADEVQTPDPGIVFDKAEFAARRARLMEQISGGAVIIWGATTQTGYWRFLQNNNFYYLSGLEIPNAVMILDGRTKRSSVFYTLTEREARNDGLSTALVTEPQKASGFHAAYPLEEFSTHLSRIISQGTVLYTPFSPQETMAQCTREKARVMERTMLLNPWDGRKSREMQFVSLVKKKFPQAEIRDCSPMIWEMRTIKTPYEIDILRRAGKIAVKAHLEIMKSVRPGLYEYELAALYEYICRKEGALGLSYHTIICSGPNHPYLHYHKHDRKLEDGDFLVIDVGPDFGYYDIDITVSYPANGKFTPRQKEIYEACNAVHEANLSVYRPGLELADARKEVNAILEKQGFDLSKDYFRRMRGGFGHYVGLAVHDVGGGPQVLKPGMVFANEPLAVFEGEDLGVRVEDTILITEDGCEILSAGLPRTVKEIEAVMKGDGIIQVLKKRKLY